MSTTWSKRKLDLRRQMPAYDKIETREQSENNRGQTKNNRGQTTVSRSKV